MPLPPGALGKPGPNSARRDDGPPEEPRGLISKSAHERGPRCASLQEWLQGGSGLASEEKAISRSATLPTGYAYEFSKAIGSVALRHANGIVVHDRPLVLGSSPGSNYVLGFHYCSSDAFREILKDRDRWPTLHCQTTTQREPAAFDGPSKAFKTLLAEGLAGPDMTADSFACCLPLRVPTEWLKAPEAARAGSPCLRAAAQGSAGSVDAAAAPTPAAVAASPSREPKSSSGEEKPQTLGKERKEKKSRRKGKAKFQSAELSTLLEESDEDEDSDADPAPPDLARDRRRQSERTIAEDAKRAAASDSRRLSRSNTSRSVGSRSTASSRPPMPPEGEEFIKTAMFQWTHMRLSGQKLMDLQWDIQLERPFDVILRARVPATGGEWLAVSVGERGGTVCMATLMIERSGQDATRMWQLALEGSGRGECAVESGSLQCSPGDEVRLTCWMSIVRQRKERWSVRLGEGLLIGESEVLRLEGTTKQASVPEPVVRVSGSSGPWDLEMAHTGHVPPGCATDFDAACKNPHLQDIHGRTALISAAALGEKRAVRGLLMGRANVHARDDSWCTALHFAAYEGHSAVAIDLIEAGGSVFTKNRSGCTPRDLARVRWRPKLPGEGEAWDSEDEEELWELEDLEEGKAKKSQSNRKKSPVPAGGKSQGRQSSNILEALNHRRSSNSAFAPPPRSSNVASKSSERTGSPLRAKARTAEYLEGAAFSGSRRRRIPNPRD